MSTLAAAFLLAGPWSVAPAPPQVPPAGGDDGPQIEASSDKLALLARAEQAHGGAEALAEFQTLTFRLFSTTIDEEGVETREEHPLQVDVPLDGDNRTVRIEEDRPSTTEDGVLRHLVKLSDGQGSSQVWADGILLPDAAMREAARLEAQQFLKLVDLLYRPRRADLAHRMDGRKTRGGVPYDTLHVEFHVERQIFEAYRVYYDLETGLVERIDVFDGKTYRRLQTILVQGYGELDGVHVPGRLEFRNQKNQPVAFWDLEGRTRDRELPPGHFKRL